ncbi:hypothetical protein DFAR_200043 [Desulfarculales bacterium]
MPAQMAILADCLHCLARAGLNHQNPVAVVGLGGDGAVTHGPLSPPRARYPECGLHGRQAPAGPGARGASGRASLGGR